MSLKVISAGFGRTGTMSLKLALEQLGLGKCHHMAEVYANPEQVPVWQAAMRREPVDWEKLYRGYGATVDWPGARYWREISQAFPDALILVTVRSPESWWASYSETIMKFLDVGLAQDSGTGREMSEWCAKAIGEQTFGSHYSDRVAGIAAFQRQTDDVSELPEDRRLVFDVKDGWAPLCDYLGLPAPDTPFPRSNSRADFWRNFSPEAT